MGSDPLKLSVNTTKKRKKKHRHRHHKHHRHRHRHRSDKNMKNKKIKKRSLDTTNSDFWSDGEINKPSKNRKNIKDKIKKISIRVPGDPDGLYKHWKRTKNHSNSKKTTNFYR